MKITQRERELLKWFVFLAILFGVYYFALRTMNERLKTLHDEQATLLQAKSIVQQTLPQYDAIKKTKQDTQLLVQDQFDQFVDIFASDAFEANILPILIEHNANILHYQASPMLVVNPESLHHPQEVFNYKLKMLIEAYNQSTQKETIVSTSSELLKTTVSYTLAISFTDYLNLVDALHELKLSIILTMSDYHFEDNLASLSLDVYSMHKLAFNQE